LKNSELDKIIETNITLVEKNLVKLSKIQIEINFYQKKVQKFYIMQELVNMWESWKFIFVLKKDSDTQLNELNNSKQKENKIREYIYCILDKLNDKFDFMPDFNIDEGDKLPNETFPFEVKFYDNKFYFYF
jgi:hypothetical protein